MERARARARARVSAWVGDLRLLELVERGAQRGGVGGAEFVERHDAGSGCRLGVANLGERGGGWGVGGGLGGGGGARGRSIVSALLESPEPPVCP